jgi:hypothetical protein
MEIARHAIALQSAIATEENKQSHDGERRKRLRTLVDVLADWWLSVGGSLAPIVDANRREPGVPAVVHRRRGSFLAFATVLLCNVDTFERSEVESAVTNVYENWLAEA